MQINIPEVSRGIEIADGSVTSDSWKIAYKILEVDELESANKWCETNGFKAVSDRFRAPALGECYEKYSWFSHKCISVTLFHVESDRDLATFREDGRYSYFNISKKKKGYPFIGGKYVIILSERKYFW
jgi:hypothetical protein